MGTYMSQVASFFQTMMASVQANNSSLTDFNIGSVLYTILYAIAVAVDMLNAAIYNVQQQAYLSSAIGSNLDLKAADYGITRKPAVAAIGPMNMIKNIAANTNIDIPAGSLITTVPQPGQTTVQWETTADATFLSGSTSAVVQVQCTTPGSIGNIPAGTQLLIASAVPGIDGVTITTALTNGIDQESDASLRQRALNSFKGLAIGTYPWYQQQALSVSGVASASVVNSYSGQSNSVGVYITGPNNTLPTSTLISQVQTLLNNSAPMIDQPTVVSPAQLTVNVAVTVTYSAGNSQSAVQTAVQTAIDTYINGLGLAAQKTVGWVYPSQMVTTALAQTGVVDAGGVTLNGGTAAVVVSASQLPLPGTVTVTANAA
ncbi:MAG: baseplate J/gp47 family protein [Acidobacteriaceae bacterium]